VAAERIRVEVAYARPERQLILAIEAEPGISAGEAIRRSGILDEFPEIDLDQQKVGVFGKAAKLDAVLTDGDRVEIYRPLIADPKEARRKRAAEGKDLKNRARKGGADKAGKENAVGAEEEGATAPAGDAD
jgi:putative ubiquitin-RnfH superfamily antitoxin RatB of RatAB toxin-antitoxin module